MRVTCIFSLQEHNSLLTAWSLYGRFFWRNTSRRGNILPSRPWRKAILWQERKLTAFCQSDVCLKLQTRHGILSLSTLWPAFRQRWWSVLIYCRHWYVIYRKHCWIFVPKIFFLLKTFIILSDCCRRCWCRLLWSYSLTMWAKNVNEIKFSERQIYK